MPAAGSTFLSRCLAQSVDWFFGYWARRPDGEDKGGCDVEFYLHDGFAATLYVNLQYIPTGIQPLHKRRPSCCHAKPAISRALLKVWPLNAIDTLTAWFSCGVIEKICCYVYRALHAAQQGMACTGKHKKIGAS